MISNQTLHYAVLQERDAKHAHDMQEASVRAVRDLEARAQQLQGQLEQAQQALLTEKAQYGQQDTLVACRKHMDTLQADLLSERHKVKQLAGKGQEVVKAKQEVLEAVTALQVTCILQHFTTLGVRLSISSVCTHCIRSGLCSSLSTSWFGAHLVL